MLGSAAVDQSRDIGMLEVCQQRALAVEKLKKGGIVIGSAQQFERDTLVEFTVRAFGEKYHAHAAGADAFEQPERADPHTRGYLVADGKLGGQTRGKGFMITARAVEPRHIRSGSMEETIDQLTLTSRERRMVNGLSVEKALEDCVYLDHSFHFHVRFRMVQINDWMMDFALYTLNRASFQWSLSA